MDDEKENDTAALFLFLSRFRALSLIAPATAVAQERIS